MIVPTIGRVVHVRFSPTTDPEPALICRVHSNYEINVGGFDSKGIPFAIENIRLLQDDDQPPAGVFYAEWMAWQKEMAAQKESA
jgi:hypothetical protein